ncbi:MAG: transcriptional repressor [Spirochaetes bacterium]|jgi:Fur family peroxide stress response transcriptional regulator|nr:transcriptional repressor [Spirochaetota bacterium]
MRNSLEVERLETRLRDALSQAKLRLTPQRIEICRVLAESEEHPTAQAIYDELKRQYPSLSMTTVYGTLDTLVKLGAITSLGNVGDERVHYEPNTTPHINLACLSCHRIVDMASKSVAELEAEVEARIGTKVLSGRVVYFGECIEREDRDQCPFYHAMNSRHGA